MHIAWRAVRQRELVGGPNWLCENTFAIVLGMNIGSVSLLIGPYMGHDGVHASEVLRSLFQPLLMV